MADQVRSGFSVKLILFSTKLSDIASRTYNKRGENTFLIIPSENFVLKVKMCLLCSSTWGSILPGSVH